jgi:type IV secretory pathway VirJ component
MILEGIYGLALLVLGSPAVPPWRDAFDPGLSDLPLIEVPVTARHGTLAVLLTGDGGWAAGDKGMADELKRKGIPVVGFISPSYLQVPRSPTGAARDLDRVLGHYLAAWQCDHILVIGYSRGADLVPFMVSRLPSALRTRITVVTLIGLSDVASFQYRPIDLFAAELRFNDYPVEPELTKLRGMRLICVSGERERGSLCPALDSGAVRIATHPGGHRLTREAGRGVAAMVVAAAAEDQSR